MLLNRSPAGKRHGRLTFFKFKKILRKTVTFQKRIFSPQIRYASSIIHSDCFIQGLPDGKEYDFVELQFATVFFSLKARYLKNTRPWNYFWDMSSCMSSGAKGIVSFAESIKYKQLPPASSLQYEGIFYDYFFETVNEQEKLFKANFNYAVTKDPLNNEREYYISFGMAGKMDGKGFYKHGGRPNLNLVIVLDISGSMDSPFNYNERDQNKLQVAKDSVLTLLTHLNENDAFSLICFDTNAYITQKPQLWKDTDQTKLKLEISQIETKGGTSLTAGIDCATQMLNEMQSKFVQRPSHPVHQHIENRIMFLTDMCPTTNDQDGSHLFELTETNSLQHKIYTTFVGIGLDFNSEIVSKIGKIRGCNYLSVKSAKDFKKMMSEDFDYLVTPNVFNVSIEMDPESEKDWRPDFVFGSPGNERPDKGRLTFVDSCFPSQKESDTSTKGGIVVVKLSKLTSSPDSSIKFKITYEDTYGKKYEDYDSIAITEHSEDFYQTKSVRKAVLLVRYINFFKNYLADMSHGKVAPSMNENTGIVIPSILPGKKSGVMKPLTTDYQVLFKKFTEYFTKEMDATEDPSLERELQHIQVVSSAGKE